jgi:hypothetical protein
LAESIGKKGAVIPLFIPLSRDEEYPAAFCEWIALIAILLLKYWMMRSTYDWNLSNLTARVRMDLLTYRNFWKWLNRPFHEPEKDAPALQMLLLG